MEFIIVSPAARNMLYTFVMDYIGRTDMDGYRTCFDLKGVPYQFVNAAAEDPLVIENLFPFWVTANDVRDLNQWMQFALDPDMEMDEHTTPELMDAFLTLYEEIEDAMEWIIASYERQYHIAYFGNNTITSIRLLDGQGNIVLRIV